MFGRLAVPTLLLLAAAGTLLAEEAPRLTIVSEAARVEIAAQPEGRRLIRLPRLEFPITIEPDCVGDTTIESVSISVADTQHRFDAADFDRESILATSLSLPRRQIGPLAIEQFCSRDDESDEKTMLITDAFTAQASLRCASEIRPTMIYETVKLGIRLLCKSVDPAADGTAKNHEPSPSSSSPSL